jgi:hypothetical protein
MRTLARAPAPAQAQAQAQGRPWCWGHRYQTCVRTRDSCPKYLPANSCLRTHLSSVCNKPKPLDNPTKPLNHNPESQILNPRDPPWAIGAYLSNDRVQVEMRDL